MCTARRPKTKTTPAGDDVPDVIKINDDEAQDASVAMVTSATKPQQRVQFCVSVNTNRIFLHDMEGTPLRCAVALADALDDDFLPAQVPGCALRYYSQHCVIWVNDFVL